MPRLGASAFETYTRESSLQTRCRRASKAVGLQVMKLTSGDGAQDLLLLGEPIAPAVVWVELKVKDGTIAENQLARWRDRLEEGYLAFIVDNYDEFLVVLDTTFNRHG